MAGATWPGRRRECGRLQHAVGSAIGVLAGVDPGARCPDHRGDHHHRHRLDLGLRRYRGWIPAADPDRVRAVDRVRGVLVLPVVLFLRRWRGGRLSGLLPGFEVPLHRALTVSILLGGAPRSLAIVNGTLAAAVRSEEHTSELQSLMRLSYAVFCLKKNKNKHTRHHTTT